MTDFEKLDASEPKGISRRTVMKGAAWAVPVIAVASATPAYASSHDPVDPTASSGTFCQHSNVGRYHGVFCFHNTVGVDVTVTLGTWTVPSGSAGVTGLFSVGTPSVYSATRVIEPGDHCYYVDSTVTSPMANGAGSIDYSWSYTLDTVVYSGSGTMHGETTGVNCASTDTQPNSPLPHTPHGP